jgi:hypothetical protein
MKLHTYIATVLVRVGTTKTWLTTEVQAESVWHATLLLEAQYGRGCVSGTPYQKH